MPICLRCATTQPVLFTLLALAGAANGWPDLPALINNADNASYLSVLSPALRAIKLSYTATYGSYRRQRDVNATLPGGWQRLPELDVDPPNGGLHGLVFFHAASRRAILAVRGTDLNSSSLSGLADTCADKLLWEGVTYDDLPGACHQFSASELDYYAAAGTFINRALVALPAGTEPLLVGHSLGAGLAVLVAADRETEQRWGPRVLGLSAPPYDTVLRSRVRREPGELDQRKLAVIYNAFDPLYRKGNSTKGNAGAAICTFAPTEPAACVQCYAVDGKERSPECDECFAKTHIAKIYLDDLNGTVEKPPPFRPQCQRHHASSGPILV